MSIKTRVSKLEEAKTNAAPDKRQAEAIAHTKAWLAGILSTCHGPKRQPITIPCDNPRQWLDDTVKAINEAQA